jgi:hypothetical protein
VRVALPAPVADGLGVVDKHVRVGIDQPGHAPGVPCLRDDPEQVDLGLRPRLGRPRPCGCGRLGKPGREEKQNGKGRDSATHLLRISAGEIRFLSGAGPGSAVPSACKRL